MPCSKNFLVTILLFLNSGTEGRDKNYVHPGSVHKRVNFARGLWARSLADTKHTVKSGSPGVLPIMILEHTNFYGQTPGFKEEYH